MILKHLLLFVATFICVSILGIIWVGQSANAESYLGMWREGALFATLLLAFLGVHEFGHYFAPVSAICSATTSCPAKFSI